MRGLSGHYARLGIHPRATDKEVTAAFRRLAQKLHPDTPAQKAVADPILRKAVQRRFQSISESYNFITRARRGLGHPAEATRKATEKSVKKRYAARADADYRNVIEIVWFPTLLGFIFGCTGLYASIVMPPKTQLRAGGSSTATDVPKPSLWLGSRDSSSSGG